MPNDPHAPVEKLQPSQLIDAIRSQSGIAIELLGVADGGEVGAAFVRLPSGEEGVLTAAGHLSLFDVRRAAGVLSLARDHGLAVPFYKEIIDLPSLGTVAVVQERLPGRTPTLLDLSLVEKFAAVNESFAGILAGREDVPRPEMYLLHSGPGYCVHEPLVEYNSSTRRLLDWVHEVGRSASPMEGDDLVHLDFHPGNVLVDSAGEISGVIDWDGLGRGDRKFALVTLRFHADAAGWDKEAQSYLDDQLDAMDPAALRVYWAHMSLRSVDWVIRHYGPRAVEERLAVAETRMD